MERVFGGILRFEVASCGMEGTELDADLYDVSEKKMIRLRNKVFDYVLQKTTHRSAPTKGKQY